MPPPALAPNRHHSANQLSNDGLQASAEYGPVAQRFWRDPGEAQPNLGEHRLACWAAVGLTGRERGHLDRLRHQPDLCGLRPQVTKTGEENLRVTEPALLETLKEVGTLTRASADCRWTQGSER